MLRCHGGFCFPVLKPYNLFSFTSTRYTTNTVTVSSCSSPKAVSLMATAIEESDVGISCYISSLPGFRGILKQRYSDFIVNEVDLDGNVVHLTCLDCPPEIRVVEEESEMKISCEMSKNISYASELESFRSIAGDTDVERLEAFIGQVNSGSYDSISHIVLSPDSDKAHRTAMHNFFKGKFKFLVTDTVDGPDASSKCIRVRFNSGGNSSNGRHSRKRKERGDKPFDSRGSNNWPEHLSKFLRFHLYKENKDTQEAIGVIGKMLGIQPRSFGFAGTKDKRSISTQRITVFKQHASRLAALNDRLIGIKVGDFCYVKEDLLLGQLLGNRFTITLRGVVADSEDTIKASVDSLGRNGFINYFGLQRFGSGSVPTHMIGAALLRGEWKTAVDMILDPRDGERDAVRKAREYYKESDDIDGTLRQFPRHLLAERSILQCLKKCPRDYLQALKAIPRTLRMMYVHSYQSYLWNHAASMRVEKYGNEQVVLGDLVYCKGGGIDKETVGDDTDCQDGIHNESSNLINDGDDTSGVDIPESKTFFVKAITTEDISSGNYTFEDVVLPMPGYKVIFPTNDVAKIYHDLAKKDGISLTESVHSVKEFSITSMTGSYRRVFQKPIDFQWELLTYVDANMPLAETDFEKISKARLINQEGERNDRDENQLSSDSTKLINQEGSQTDVKPLINNNELEGERELKLQQGESISSTNSQEAQTALQLSFTLPSSCYATMAIRELLKTSTSVAFHKTLNQ